MPRSSPKRLQGTVVSVHGQFARVLTEDGAERRLRSRKKVGPLASGDRVLWVAESGGGSIVEREPRTTLLSRFDDMGRARPVAANLDLVLIVWAPRPPSPAGFIDRYLATLTHQGLAAAVVANKADVDTEADRMQREAHRDLYTSLEYPWCDTSAHSGLGLDALAALLANKCSAFVGQSGVGKSSLVNALGDNQAQTTGALTEDESHGRHTTSASRLLELPGGIRIIDSPGIRNFETGQIPPAELQQGFPELLRHAQHCKFRNCLHRREPGCAVLAAAEQGEIAQVRLRSYHAMLDDSEQLAAERFS